MDLFYAWICYTQAYKERETVDIKGMGTVQKGTPINVTMTELEEFTV